MGDLEQLRSEKKYLIQDYTFEEVKRIIADSSLNFKEIYKERKINNIYFDSFDFKGYHDNIDGISNRVKYRIRWYGENFFDAQSPTLEFKIKHGNYNFKKSYSCPSFSLEQPLIRQKCKELLLAVKLPVPYKYEVLGLHPVLINTYNRNYYLSEDKKIRLTIDRNLHAQAFTNHLLRFNQQYKKNSNLVLEAKYAIGDENLAALMSVDFPFRLTRNSKFVNGLTSIF